MNHGFNRSDRVAGELRRELAVLIQQELDDPAVGEVAVSDVEVSRDLAVANVYVTVLDAETADDSIKALSRAAGFLRHKLARQIRMRSVPSLRFHYDASLEQGERIESLLRQSDTDDRSQTKGSN